MQSKRLMAGKAEEELTKTILEQVRKNNITISNLKEVTAKVVSYLESNAILEMEDSGDAESSVL